MIYHAQNKHAVLISLEDVPHVPRESLSRYQEKSGYLIVPDDIDTMRLLSRYGLRMPSRMKCDYHWKSKFKSPFAHQIVTSEFLVNNPRAFIHNEIGTAKTLSALWAADYLQSQGLMGRVIISSTLSTLWRTWEDAIWSNFPGKTFRILYGSKERRLEQLSKAADFYIVNHHGVNTLTDWRENASGGYQIAGSAFDDLLSWMYIERLGEPWNLPERGGDRWLTLQNGLHYLDGWESQKRKRWAARKWKRRCDRATGGPVKARDGFYTKHFDAADGTRYRVEASRQRGWWTGEVFKGTRRRQMAGYTVEDDELADPTDGDEACDLAWKRFGLEG